MTHSAELTTAARAWLAADPDPQTRAELERVLADASPAAAADLADRFAGKLEFGTAGLRGVIGAGPNRMNRAVVLRTSHGLGAWVAKQPEGTRRGVVIGYDGRMLSRELAEDTALVLAHMGIGAWLFADLGPTPRLAFAVAQLGATAGVMVTASHNPPEYNGYKVYGPNAAQIVPPADIEIAAAIDRAPPAKDVPRAAMEDARKRGLVRDVPPEVERAYLDGVKKLVRADRAQHDRGFPIVYTALHGVGAELTMRAFAENGFTRVTSVPEQHVPDGKFPTVAFPNPEEKGAMDLVLALAKKERAELVVANDPDADRLAVAVPNATGDGYVQLTGNQVGALLGYYLLKRDAGIEDPLVITTIVSSPMLGVMAQQMGAHYDEVLTGFKWIATRAMQALHEDNWQFLFGYEEALGYSVGTLVRDKDGVSAAVVFAELVADLRSRGQTVLGQLEALAREFGLFVSDQVSITKKGADGAAAIRAMTASLRAKPPERIGPLEVLAVRDYQTQTRRDVKTGEATKLTLPVSDVVAFELAGGSRVIARPSGTEPKIKLYFDVREPMTANEPVTAARTRADLTMTALKKAFVEQIAAP